MSNFPQCTSRWKISTIVLLSFLLFFPAYSQKTILSGCEFDYPPYCIVTSDNRADGFSVELLRASLLAVGYNVSFTTGLWDEVKRLLIDGKIEVLPLVGRTPEREKQFDFTFPYLRMHGTIVIRNGDSTIHTLEDLKFKSIAVMKGDNAEEFVRRVHAGASIITTPTFEEAITGCAEKKYDAVIIQKLLALQLFAKLNCSTLKFAGPPLDGFVQNFCFAVKKGDRELLGLLNEGLSITLADKTFARLYTKWFTPIETSVKTKSRIVVGGDYNYPPYEFIDEHGQPAGFNVELTRAIAEVAGLNIDIQLRPWNEIMDALDRGEIDVVHGMYYSLQRDSLFNFSPPHSIIGHVIVCRKASRIDNLLTIDSLHDKSVIVMHNDIMHEIALAKGLKKQLVIVNNEEDALALLAAGQHDCALVARVPALYWIKKHHWNNLTVASKNLHDAEYCYSVPHANHALLERFTEGLKTVEGTGKFRTIYAKWLKVYDPPVFGIVDFIKYFSIIIIPGCLLLLLSLFWSRKLTRTVAQRTAALNREIEERVAAEARLAAEKDHLAITLRSIGEGVITTDVAGNVQSLNGVAEHLCGVSSDAAVGRSFDSIFQLINEHSGAIATSPLTQLFTQQQTIENERDLVLLHRDGTKRSVSYIGAPIYNCDSGMSGSVFVFRDITEQQKMLDLMQRNEILESLGVLAGGIAHDFNNLMGGVFGYIDLALDAVTDDKVTKPLTKAIAMMQRAQQLTARLLTFSKGGTPVCTAGKVSPLLYETTQKLLKNSQIKCIYSIPDDLSYASFDVLQITQVVEYLVVNAKEAMTSGGTLSVTARNISFQSHEFEPLAAGSFVQIMFTDTGIGISPNIQPRIFDPFFSTKINHKGLGLSICHSIIAKHNGVITVVSEPDKGSSFSIYLPAAEENHQKNSAAAHIRHSGKGTFLVMDDEIVIQDIVGTMLKGFGYTIHAVYDGTEAIEVFTHDIISSRSIVGMIFDLTIPGGMGGKEAVAEIRKLDAAIPVFVASGYSDDPVLANPENYGFTGSITKPFLKDELSNLLVNHLHEKSDSDEVIAK